MISKKTKSFLIEGENYCFDIESFRFYFNKFAKENEIKIMKLEENIADKLYLTKEAVHNWRFGSNGPGDLDLIKKLSDLINVKYVDLLKKTEEEKTLEKYTTEQVVSIKCVYDVIIDFLDEFYRTDGFNDLFYDFKEAYEKEIIKTIEKDGQDFVEDIKIYVENKVADIYKVIKKERFYLRNTEIYYKLWDYVDNELDEIYNGKLEYAYRFEAMVNGNPSTEEDYLKAYKRINEIIEQYVVL